MDSRTILPIRHPKYSVKGMLSSEEELCNSHAACSVVARQITSFARPRCTVCYVDEILASKRLFNPEDRDHFGMVLARFYTPWRLMIGLGMLDLAAL